MSLNQSNLQKNRIDTNHLYEIIEDIPGLKSADILFCAPVYYPIAEVSVNYKERNFEDFEAVEQLLLSLYNLNVVDPFILSQTLGIPINYVNQTLKVLEGYGFIDSKNKTVTQSGKISLKEGRKIYTSNVEQIFQLDLLNKQFLKLEDRIRNSNLKLLSKTYKESSTYNEIGHLDFRDNFDTKKILNQLNHNFNNLVVRSSESLRQIPEKLNKITPVPGFKYAPGYMLLIKDFENPIIVVKRYNPTATKRSKRNVWKPLGVNNQKELEKLKLNNLNLNTVEARNYIIDLFNDLAKQDYNVDTELDELYSIIPFNKEGIESATRNQFKDTFKINRVFFKTYDPYIFQILKRIVDDGEFLIIRLKLYGQLLSLTTQDPILIELNNLYKQSILKLGSQKAVIGLIREKVDKNEPVIVNLTNILTELNLNGNL